MGRQRRRKKLLSNKHRISLPQRKQLVRESQLVTYGSSSTMKASKTAFPKAAVANQANLLGLHGPRHCAAPLLGLLGWLHERPICPMRHTFSPIPIQAG